MTQSFRDAIQAAARAEPAVGDPYERFLRRRRRSRGLRTLLGVVVAAFTMIGFVRVFPGGTGATPNDGFIPGGELAPGLEPFERIEVEPLALTVYVPDDWHAQRSTGALRIGPDLSTPAPHAFEMRFGALDPCAVEACTAIGTAVTQPETLRAAGIVATPASLQVGALSQDVTQLRFPDRSDDAIAPWCAGCSGYYAEIGRGNLPLLVLARDEATLRAHRTMLAAILENLQVG